MAEIVKRQAIDKVVPHFPDDILIEILIKLPARSLVLFKSVSKHWYALIQSPKFISLHLNRPVGSHPDHNSVLILRGVKPVSHLQTLIPMNSSEITLASTLMSDDETPTYMDQVSLEALWPSINGRRYINSRLLGPCHGLFCITNRFDLVVFNPVIRQGRKVPRSPFIPPSSKHGDSIVDFELFGFDSVSNDYKVVGFREYMFDDDDDGYSSGSSDSSDRHYYMIEIFSLSANTWTEVDCVMPPADIRPLSDYDLFLNGAFHWIGPSFDNICSIVVFDLNKEAIKQFEVPNKFPHYDLSSIYLSVLNECFTIVVNKVPNRWFSSDKVKIWVMKEYGVHNSWTKLYNINTGIDIKKPLSFYNDGEFLFQDDHKWLVSFNFNTKVIKKLKVDGLLMSALIYRESLVSPWRF